MTVSPIGVDEVLVADFEFETAVAATAARQEINYVASSLGTAKCLNNANPKKNPS